MKRWLIWEYAVLFLAMPALIAWLKPRSLIYGLLWLFTMLSGHRLERAFGWSFRSDWNAAGLNRAAMKDIMVRFIPFAVALFFFTWTIIPDRLFSFPMERPSRWVLVMLLYPPLSALSQEIIFRSFIFRRFAPLFNSCAINSESRSGASENGVFENRNASVRSSTCVAEAQKTPFIASRSRDYGLIVASALAFGWVHIILMNCVAVVFSFFGGLFFAHTYSKTKSLAACCFEHALYGCYIFTLGLGFYFYHGNAVH